MARLQDVNGIGLLADRPTPGMPGRYYFAEDESVMYRDNGAAWVSVASAGSGGSESSTYATRPAAGNEGALFLPTDGPYIERDTGAAWQSWGPLYRMTPPVDAAFTWVNQDAATVTTTNGGVYIESPGAAGNEFHIRYKSAPATPYTITAYFVRRPLMTSGVYEFGLCFRQSSDGKLAVFGVQGAGPTSAPYLYSAKVASPTAATVNYLAVQYQEMLQPHFFRIADNGTNRICSVSRDGVHFTAFQSVARTDYLTADQVGFYVRDPASGSVGAWLLSWQEA
jgi:hypothetical protein